MPGYRPVDKTRIEDGTVTLIWNSTKKTSLGVAARVATLEFSSNESFGGQVDFILSFEDREYPHLSTCPLAGTLEEALSKATEFVEYKDFDHWAVG